MSVDKVGNINYVYVKLFSFYFALTVPVFVRPLPSAGDCPVEAGPGRLAVGRPPRQGLRRTPGPAQGHNSITTFGLSCHHHGPQKIPQIKCCCCEQLAIFSCYVLTTTTLFRGIFYRLWISLEIPSFGSLMTINRYHGPKWINFHIVSLN